MTERLATQQIRRNRELAQSIALVTPRRRERAQSKRKNEGDTQVRFLLAGVRGDVVRPFFHKDPAAFPPTNGGRGPTVRVGLMRAELRRTSRERGRVMRQLVGFFDKLRPDARGGHEDARRCNGFAVRPPSTSSVERRNGRGRFREFPKTSGSGEKSRRFVVASADFRPRLGPVGPADGPRAGRQLVAARREPAVVVRKAQRPNVPKCSPDVTPNNNPRER